MNSLISRVLPQAAHAHARSAAGVVAPPALPGDGELAGAVDDTVVLERDVIEGHGQPQGGNAPEQRFVDDLEFLAGQVLPDAQVRAVAEGDVAPGATLDVEFLGVGEGVVGEMVS